MKSKKKVIGVLIVILKLTLDILGLRGHSFFSFFKGSLLKKKIGNPVLECDILI